MTEVAGEVADGFFVHPFHTPEYLRATTLPALERGLTRSGRGFADFEISYMVMVATGTDEQQVKQARDATRSQIAFYGSTPAYRGVLEQHGWGELQVELNQLSKRGLWAEMTQLIDDKVLHSIAVCGEPSEIAEKVRTRCGEFAARVSLVGPYSPDFPPWARVIHELKSFN